MPEMTVTVRWPDGVMQICYSPSLVMYDYLKPGHQYAVADFRQRSAKALSEASERVRAKYGVACSSAMDTNEQIIAAAARYDDDSFVDIAEMDPPFPSENL